MIFFPGFEKPSAIQQRAIKPVMKGRDVIAQAQSGTGKTATFSISILQTLDTQLRETQVLVLSPTRELATQIQKVILALGDFMNVQCHACIGGTNLSEDIRKLDYGQHVVSGTPGRVFGKYFSLYVFGKIIKISFVKRNLFNSKQFLNYVLEPSCYLKLSYENLLLQIYKFLNGLIMLLVLLKYFVLV